MIVKQTLFCNISKINTAFSLKFIMYVCMQYIFFAENSNLDNINICKYSMKENLNSRPTF